MTKLLILFAFLMTPLTFADNTFTFIIQKQEAKKETRWSLESWLETRDRMMLMDLWLAMNSPSPYEFYLGTDYALTPKNFQFHLGGFASIFGLEVNYNMHRERLLGMFRLRVLGYNDQNTNLTLEGGVRQEKFITDALNPFASASLTFYFARFFGIQSRYRYFFNSKTLSDGAQSFGRAFEAGPFIDFSFVRIFGLYQSERTTRAIGLDKTLYKSNTVSLGLRAYF